MTPHKHAEVIKKWADGYVVQARIGDEDRWGIITNPSWYEHYQYRVKPTASRYRVALIKGYNGYFTTVANNSLEEDKIMSAEAFVRFLTDWIEYEV